MSEVTEFVNRSVKIIEEVNPHFFEEHLTTKELFEKTAVKYVATCNEVIPLNFTLLSEVEDHHVLHDFMGIMQHWNIYGNEMLDCFHPRCAL